MRYFHGKLAAVVLACAVTSTTLASNLSVNPDQVHQEKTQFIQQLVTRYHFNQEKLAYLFRHLHRDKKIIRSMTQPFEKQPWTYYRDFFITPKRVTLGAQYLKDHHAALQAISEKYGVPESIIVAILGIETEYGRHVGKYSVLRTLYTLGFYYPPREKFFRKELAQYLILTRDNHLNTTGIKGSYAGALGIPQFMPSSYRHFGVAFHPGEPVNLFNQNDAIASVANYFYKNGWKANQPITQRTHTAHGKGIIALSFKDHTQYWKTYHNFDVIMSYNHNVVYAMAVYQLSQKIEKQYALLR